jgi:hypothetical protein
MNSSEIVKLYDAKISGQQLLIPDDDFTLRNTPFKDTGNKQLNKEILVHWWMNVYQPDSYQYDTKTPYEIYRTWSNAVRNHFHFAKAEGSYHVETGQSSVQLSCYKKKKLDAHIYELKMWLPYIKLAKALGRRDNDERLHKQVSIFEHTLSEFGIFTLCIFSDNEVVLKKNSYGTVRDVQKFTDLTSAVKYIQEQHYYE